jgi:hypothetical protein
MKFNKWTIGLAAVGAVSLASAAKADEKLTAVQTALSSTTISGYVDTSAQWNFGTGTGGNFYKFDGRGKSDGFNLNVVQVSIAKPLDESEWASGYKVDLWFGPDANTLGTSSVGGNAADFNIRQAYVALRTPVGNGIDWKMGVFDSIIGYESVESGNNPNFTRSYGHSIEPQTHTGLLGTYRVCEEVAFSAGVANTTGPRINQRSFLATPAVLPGRSETYKTYMVSVALTAPQDWGWVAGSTLYAGFVDGFSAANLANTGPAKQTSWYVGATLATPVTGLKFGASFDYLDSGGRSTTAITANGNDIWAAGVYASYQATEKLSAHLRGEFVSRQNQAAAAGPFDNAQAWSLTGTVQYDLWQNVISRLEIRWDHGDEFPFYSGSTGAPVGGVNSVAFTQRNSVMVAANIIYKF